MLNDKILVEQKSRVYLAPQEPTSSLVRRGANIGKKELQGEEDEDEEVQGGQEGRRSQEAKPRRLMGKQGVANNLNKKRFFIMSIFGFNTAVNFVPALLEVADEEVFVCLSAAQQLCSSHST